jgi:hypothetical protein
MFNKHLGVLFLVFVFALANVRAYANGGFTHQLIAKKALDAIEDQQIKQILQENFGAYYLGSHFPDVGLMGKKVKRL